MERETSGLNYTLIRPAWPNSRDNTGYGNRRNGKSCKNSSKQVSHKSVADLVVKLAATPGLGIHSSLGAHRIT